MMHLQAIGIFLVSCIAITPMAIADSGSANEYEGWGCLNFGCTGIERPEADSSADEAPQIPTAGDYAGAGALLDEDQQEADPETISAHIKEKTGLDLR